MKYLNLNRSPLFTLLMAAMLAIPLSTKAASVDSDAQARAQLHLMAGEIAAGRNQPRIAAIELLKALEVVDDKELASRATSYALTARDTDLSLAAARRWLQLDPTAMDAREVIARMSLRKGNAPAVVAQAEEIIKGNAKGEDEGLLQVGRILVQSEAAQADVALEVMTKVAAQRPASASAQHALSLVALRFNKLDAADAASQAAVNLEPENREHALLRIGVLVKQNKLEEADQKFAVLLKDEKNPSELRMGYVKLLLEADQREHARQQLEAHLKEVPDYADALYAMGVLSYSDRDYAAAESYFKQLLSGPRDQEAAYQMGRIAEARKDNLEALNYYSRVTKGNLAIEAAIRRAYALASLKQVDEAQKTMQQLREQIPQLAQRFYLAEADMLLQNNQFDVALEVYGEALKIQPDDDELLYGRSILYERMGRINLAEKDLRSMLAQDADDARAMNALGYMLAVHTKRLGEAKKLITRALELNPEDPAVMDSMGWVQFKLGKKSEARTLLLKAFERFPDPEVAAHLGEVLWTLGEKDQARAVWQQAMKESPDHAALKETIERLSK